MNQNAAQSNVIAAEAQVEGCITASDYVNDTLVVAYSYRKDSNEDWLHFLALGDLELWFNRKKPQIHTPVLGDAACSIRFSQDSSFVVLGSTCGKVNVLGLTKDSVGNFKFDEKILFRAHVIKENQGGPGITQITGPSSQITVGYEITCIEFFKGCQNRAGMITFGGDCELKFWDI